MSSIFVETVSKAIREYRQLLRRHLPQSNRMVKLTELKLRRPDYTSDAALYRIAHRIVQDIEKNLGNVSKGYYTYSGIGNFGHYLREFLSNYTIETNRVVHRAQKASRALLEVIQVLSLPAQRLTPEVLAIIRKSNETVARYGSDEQCELYRKSLERRCQEGGNTAVLFEPLLCHFKEQRSRTHELVSKAKAA